MKMMQSLLLERSVRQSSWWWCRLDFIHIDIDTLAVGISSWKVRTSAHRQGDEKSLTKAKVTWNKNQCKVSYDAWETM